MSTYFFYVAHTGKGANGNGVSAIDPATGQIHATVSLGSPKVGGLVAAPGATLLYALVDDQAEVRVIDLDTLAVTASIDVPGGDPGALAIAPDGKCLYVANDEGVAEVDTATRTVQRTFTSGGSSQFYSVAVSADSRFLYAVGRDRIVRFDLGTGESTSNTELSEVGSVLVSPDGNRLYAAAPGKALYLLDASALTVAHTLEGWPEWGQEALSPDGKRLFVTDPGSDDDRGAMVDTASREGVADFVQAPAGRQNLVPVALSPDGTVVCTAHRKAVTAGIDTDSKAYSDELPGEAVAITTAAPLRPQSTRLETGTARTLVPLRVEGLTARLTTTGGAPVSGAQLRFTSAGGLDLGTATTDTDGRVNHTAELLLPLDPDTRGIDTSRLAGPYKVTYPGKPAYGPTETEGTLD
ncbi:WD40 repeat domain-containing protein [Streptomyces sp. NPDC015125]|uniref:WD40 repeat domain-containing protein n=1 Tax=Streptomyces sp. NPDC015125 TaxID=3364938 RepID=UPI0036F65386